MPIHLTPESNPVVQEGTLFVDSATGEFNVAGRTVPHIIPGVLYPAVSGNDINGNALGGSYVYGTAHTDGRKYYYTDIKGSKPIKDPRIGGHFGSQRHKFRSIQLLEQETATHGLNVYSGDGREWMRFVGNSWTVRNDSYGHQLALYGVNVNTDTTNFIEIVGYFSGANMSAFTNHDAPDTIDCVIDGTDTGSNGSFATSVATPLISRYIDSGSFINLPLGSTSLGIHTLRINPTNSSSETNYFMIGSLELIAQDTSSTANRSKIQIPSQNVVSFGKKFTVSAEGSSGHHYNPFNGYTATNSFSSVVDVDTSLGLEAWKHTDNNYYPPVNGGRIVKWLDSSGVIKTSVTLMPPNATGIGSFSSNPRDPNYGSWSSQYQPTFKNETERQLHEVAKTYYARDFGNGGANHNASYKDATSMDMDSNATHDIAYVMDDGLTSISANDVTHHGGGSQNPKVALGPASGTQYIYITFIGTGFSWTDADGTINNTAQNLPYGSHIAKINRSDYSISIDGVSIHTVSSGDTFALLEVSFFQPKRPPIPEDACVLADYMLMADLVKQTAATAGHISKGTRFLSSSRDFFYDAAGAWTGEFTHPAQGTGGHNLNRDANDATAKVELPFFGTNFISEGYQGRFVSKLNDSALSNVSELTGAWVSKKVGDGTTLGLHKAGVHPETNNLLFFASMQIATPIHTSHHYQSFETPFLHELVGGDRNIEQTNLVCTPDGKSWDEVTRDTSYISKTWRVQVSETTATAWSTFVVLTDWRGRAGSTTTNFGLMNKDFAIAYDRMICLVDGIYRMSASNYSTNANSNLAWYVNGDGINIQHANEVNTPYNVEVILPLARGDFVQLRGEFGTDGNNNNIVSITKV